MDLQNSTSLKSKRVIYFIYFIVFLISVIFLLYFSTATSPLFPNTYGVDSAFYRFAGKMMLQGKILYKDIWDNKGPILFFIQAIGALAGTDNSGPSLIFGLQIISLFISLFFLQKTFQTVNQNKSSDWLFLFFTICYLAMFGKTIESGNLSEEWCLPYISCSLYLLVKYAVNAETKIEHPGLFAFFHGICIAIIAFIRLNNSISIFIGITAVMVFLAHRRKWKNLVKNIVYGFMGICVVTIPVALFFKSKEALRDMLYSAFFYNLKYMMRGGAHQDIGGMDLILRFLPMIAAFGIIFLHLIRTQNIRFTDILCLSIAAANTILLWFSNNYLHYYTIFIPVFFLFLVLYVRIQFIPEMLLTLFACSFFIVQDIQMISGIEIPNTHPAKYQFAASISEEEKDSVIGIWVSPEIYLTSDLSPVSRYCAYQFIHFSVDPAMQQTFMGDIQRSKPKWIIILPGYEESYDPEIRNFLSNGYTKVFEEDGAAYYHSGT